MKVKDKATAATASAVPFGPAGITGRNTPFGILKPLIPEEKTPVKPVVPETRTTGSRGNSTSEATTRKEKDPAAAENQDDVKPASNSTDSAKDEESDSAKVLKPETKTETTGSKESVLKKQGTSKFNTFTKKVGSKPK